MKGSFAKNALVTFIVAVVGVTLPLGASARPVGSTSAYASTLTGDWGGARAALAAKGVNLSLDFLVQPTTNLAGGARRAVTAPDQITLGGDFDLGKLVGWRGGSFHMLIVERDGKSLDFGRAQLGTLLPSQNAYGLGQYAHLTNFFFEQSLAQGRIDVKAGRMFWQAAGFYPYPCDFQSLVFCGGLPTYITQGIENIARSQNGVSVSIQPYKSWYVRLGWFKVNPANDEKAHAWNVIAPGRNVGTLTSFEFGVHTRLAGNTALPGLWAIGAWHNTTRYPDLLPIQDTSVAALEPVVGTVSGVALHSTSGTYFYGQQQVTASPAGGGATIFATIVNSDEQTDKVDSMQQIGVIYKGILPWRLNDSLNFAIGRMHINPRYTTVLNLETGAVGEAEASALLPRGYEYESELDYNIAIGRGVSIMPNLQYVYHPGGIRSRHAAVLLGLQANFVF